MCIHVFGEVYRPFLQETLPALQRGQRTKSTDVAMRGFWRKQTHGACCPVRKTQLEIPPPALLSDAVQC